MKTVDRYLIAHFTRFFAFAAAVFLLLFFVVDFFEKLQFILKYRPSFGDAALYFAARIPWMVTQLLPSAALVATLLSVSLLARRSELTALRCNGISLLRLAAPYAVAGAALCAVHGFVQELVSPPSFAWAHEIREVRIRKRPPRNVLRASDLWLKMGSRIVHIDAVAPDGERLYGVDLAEIDGARMRRRVQAREARRSADHWLLTEVVERVYAADGSSSRRELATLPMAFAEEAQDFDVWMPEPEEASWLDLVRWIRRHRQQGIDSRDLEVDLWAKTSFPLANLVMVLLAFPLATYSGRRGSSASTVVLALVLGFGYWICFAAGLSVGKAGSLPAPAAAWAGNAVFLGVAAILLWRAENSA